MSAILGATRHLLSDGDLDFLCQALTSADGDQRALKSLLRDPEELDRLLDHPAVWSALGDPHQPFHGSARFFFYLLARHALLTLGLDDRETASYVANMLSARGHSESWLFPFKAPCGNVLYSVDLLEQLQAASPGQRFFLHASAGDHYLLVTTFFAAYIEDRARHRGSPGLAYYEGVGISSYEHARDHRLAREYDLQQVFDTLARAFPKVRVELAKAAEAARAHN